MLPGWAKRLIERLYPIPLTGRWFWFKALAAWITVAHLGLRFIVLPAYGSAEAANWAEGRDLVLEVADWSSTPLDLELTAHDVLLKTEDGTPLLEADAITFDIHLDYWLFSKALGLPLFDMAVRGSFDKVAIRARLHEPEITVFRSEAGRYNWRLLSSSAKGVASGSRRLTLKSLTATDAELKWSEAATIDRDGRPFTGTSDLDIHDVEIKLRDVVLSPGNGSRETRVEELTGKLAGGKIVVSGVLDLLSSPRDLDLDVRVTSLPAKALPFHQFEGRGVDGKITAKISVDLDDVKQLLQVIIVGEHEPAPGEVGRGPVPMYVNLKDFVDGPRELSTLTKATAAALQAARTGRPVDVTPNQEIRLGASDAWSEPQQVAAADDEAPGRGDALLQGVSNQLAKSAEKRISKVVGEDIGAPAGELVGFVARESLTSAEEPAGPAPEPTPAEDPGVAAGGEASDGQVKKKNPVKRSWRAVKRAFGVGKKKKKKEAEEPPRGEEVEESPRGEEAREQEPPGGGDPESRAAADGGASGGVAARPEHGGNRPP